MLKYILTLMLMVVMCIGVWSPMPGDDSGYSWVYSDGNGRMIGRCYYKYMRINGIEQWRGVFYGQQTDFSFNPFVVDEMESLAECVEWVEDFSLGGYYL